MSMHGGTCHAMTLLTAESGRVSIASHPGSRLSIGAFCDVVYDISLKERVYVVYAASIALLQQPVNSASRITAGKYSF